jgi:hypothetical protein
MLLHYWNASAKKTFPCARIIFQKPCICVAGICIPLPVTIAHAVLMTNFENKLPNLRKMATKV